MGVAFTILFALVFVFSVYLGFTVGSHLGERVVTSREYWMYNLGIMVACILATAILTMVPLLYAAPLGFLSGSIVGLKMSFGESVGPWKLLDRFLNVNRRHRATAAAGTGEERRRRRRAGEEGPALISVENKGARHTGDAPATGNNSTRKKR